MSIDIERIKKYNENYKAAQSKAVQLRTELDMNNKEIDRLCAELSNDLGETVTRDNINEVYTKYANEINQKLALGESILARIANDTAEQTNGVGAVAPQVNGVNGVAPQVNGVTPQVNPMNFGMPANGQQAMYGAVPNVGVPQMRNNNGAVGVNTNSVPNTGVPQMNSGAGQGQTPNVGAGQVPNVSDEMMNNLKAFSEPNKVNLDFMGI